MALGDPFGTTYEGARRGAGAFGEALIAIAETQRQRAKEERERAEARGKEEREREERRKEREEEVRLKERALKTEEEKLKWTTIGERRQLHTLLETQLQELYRKYRNKPEEALRDFEQDKDIWTDLFSPLFGEGTEEVLRNRIQNYFTERQVQKRTLPTLSGMFGITPSVIDETKPAVERLGRTVGEIAPQMLRGLGKIPTIAQRIMGGVGDVTRGFVGGATGLEMPPIPQQYLQAITGPTSPLATMQGVPTAVNFMRLLGDLLLRRKTGVVE